MKRSAVLLLFIAAAAHAELTMAPPPEPATLQWRNGESLPGELIDASADEAAWRTNAFEDPLHLRWRSLRRIDQPQEAIAPTDPFSISLRDGSRIYGVFIDATDQSISIRGARHGNVVLKRSEVLSIRRIHGGDITSAGPTSDAGWSILANRESDQREIFAFAPGAGGQGQVVRTKKGSTPTTMIPQLTVGVGGALILPYWNRSAALNTPLPDLAEIDFRVRSSGRPDFRLSLEGASNQWLRIETWEEELVLASGDQFQELHSVAENERTVALRLCWDRKARACSVYSPEGKLIAAWKTPESTAGGSNGLILENKGRDLSLEYLRVRSWNGEPPPPTDVTQPRLELADEQVIEGQLSSGAANTVHWKKRGEAAETDVPIRDVDAFIFSDEAPKSAPTEAMLAYADGTILMGRILSIADGRAAVRVSFSEEPLEVEMKGLRQVLLGGSPAPGDAPETPLSDLDELVVGETTLHGKFSGAGDRWPRWLPVGAAAPSIPSKTLSLKIRRAIPETAPAPAAQALFYLQTGDVLPGRLEAVDHSGAGIESDVVETTKLSAGNLDAIQLGATAQRNIDGFADPGWTILRGDEKTVVRKDGALRMDPETAISHASAMQTNELKFMMDNTGFTTARLRLYCAGADPARSLSLLVARMGERVYAGMELVEGQLGTQFQMKAPSSRPLAVRLVIMERQIELYLNDVLAQKVPTDPTKRAGTGLIIEPASLWGNSVSTISLSGFSAHAIPGQTWLPEVDREIKVQALTVPRFRRNDLPRQALLAANGDVLRGEIEAVTASHFGFRSGLETLQVPRDRVKAIIWLKPPDKEAQPAPAKNPTLDRLQERIVQRVRLPRASLRTFIQIIQTCAPDLKFQLPEREDLREFPMELQGETIEQTLNHMCAIFGLHYHLAADGTIVLQITQRTAKNLVQKVYWLKPEAFSSVAAVQEELAKRGIPFPPGASANWLPEIQQLAVLNTANNHEKLREILEADFGGLLGSPTHWLLLTSGARLSFAVEKIEPDSIIGRHPLYGQCHVPMSQVYSITTAEPTDAAPLETLRDWRLVLAPEPVIPEAGGEGAPSLGKEASLFKLPLLGGGQFSLIEERGKIVILDFWATWCGPCVKSLPGLTEALSAFPENRVKFIGVNQAEPAAHVKQFMDARGWKFNVALDSNQDVAHEYGVEGIPHTVIIGPDGKVAWVKTGYSPDGEKEAAEAVKKLLESATDKP